MEFSCNYVALDLEKLEELLAKSLFKRGLSLYGLSRPPVESKHLLLEASTFCSVCSNPSFSARRRLSTPAVASEW